MKTEVVISFDWWPEILLLPYVPDIIPRRGESVWFDPDIFPEDKIGLKEKTEEATANDCMIVEDVGHEFDDDLHTISIGVVLTETYYYLLRRRKKEYGI